MYIFFTYALFTYISFYSYDIYIYIYIYIVNHRQTVSFYQNSSVWLDTQDARSRNRERERERVCVREETERKIE